MKKKTVSFAKMVASGNDFVIVDNRSKQISSVKLFAQKVCRRHRGIGADGVLLMEKSSKAPFRMRIVNSDGTEAEACGNGSRCIARFAHRELSLPKSFYFDSLSGLIQAEIRGEGVRVRLSQPCRFRHNRKLKVLGQTIRYDFVWVGVPHTVIVVEDLAKADVWNIGAAIRQHHSFAPDGTNVNFVQVSGKKQMTVWTYERGVEDVTLACGTGSVASAIMGFVSGLTQPPTRILTRGGEVLRVDFQSEGGRISDVTLEGNAEFVFDGSLRI